MGHLSTWMRGRIKLKSVPTSRNEADVDRSFMALTHFIATLAEEDVQGAETVFLRFVTVGDFILAFSLICPRVANA